MSEWKPTGRTRYRLHRPWIGRAVLVLQIEVRGIETRMIGGWFSSDTVDRWRDADVSDLPTLAVGAEQRRGGGEV